MKRKLKLSGLAFSAWLLGANFGLGQEVRDQLKGCATLETCREIIVSLIKIVDLREEEVKSLKEESQILSMRNGDLESMLRLQMNLVENLENLQTTISVRFETLIKLQDRRYEELRRAVSHKIPLWVKMVDWGVKGVAVYGAVRVSR